MVGRSEALLEALPTGYGETWCRATLEEPTSVVDTHDGIEAFRSELAHEAGGKLKSAALWVFSTPAGGGFPLLVTIELRRFDGGDGRTQLQVDGSERTSVEGVYAQLLELTERRFRAVAEQQEAARAKQERLGAPVAAGAAPGNAKRRWWDNPYSVQIIGGIIATVVAAVILFLLLGH